MENLFRSTISKASYFFLVLFASIGFAHGQSPSDWTLQSENNGVKLYSGSALCGDKNMLVFKFENTNASARHINYNVIVKSEGRNMPLLPQSLELDASETKSGSCDSSKELIADLKDVTSYELKVTLIVN